MKLADAIAEFESMFAKIEETTVYADDIVEIVCGGMKSEGERTPVLCMDEATAVRMWFEAAQRYRHQSPGNLLVWRIKPDVDKFKFYYESYEHSPDGGLVPIMLWKSYSRFAIRKA